MIDTTRKRRRRGRPRGQAVDGELLRTWRRDQGMTLAATAEQLGLSERTLRTVERGGPVSIGTIRQIADHCEIPYAQLVRAAEPTRSERLLTFGFAPPAPPIGGARRDALIEAIADDVLGDSGVIAIGGRSGIGKTWLARHVADRVAETFGDRVVWLSGASLQSPRHRIDLQQRLADALGFADHLPRHELVGEDAFHRAFCATFWKEPRLLVIDDLPSARACRHFAVVDGVPNASPRILVTTRYRHVAATWAPRVHIVPGLETEQSRLLLAESIDDERLQRDRRAVDDLVRLFAGVPRVLHIAARMLAREPYTPVGDFVRRVRDEPNALLPRTMADDWGRDEASEVRRHGLFELHLSADARALHSSIAIFGGRSFSLRWAAAAHGADDAFTRRALSELADVFLIEEERTGATASGGSTRFQLDRHSLLTARARGTSGIRAARRRLTAFAASEVASITSLPGSSAARAWTAAEGAFATAFDRACAPVLSMVTGSLRRPAPRELAGEAPCDAATRSVGEMLLALGPLMSHFVLPNSPPWFLTGWLDAMHRGDRDAASRLATRCARQATQEGRFEHARIWIDAALVDTAAPHERELLDAWAARLCALDARFDEARARLDAHPRPHSAAAQRALGVAHITLLTIEGRMDEAARWAETIDATSANDRVTARVLDHRVPSIEDVGRLARHTDPLTAASLFSSRTDDATAVLDARTARAWALRRGTAGPAALVAQQASNPYLVLRSADPPFDEPGSPPLTAVDSSSFEIGPVVVPATAVAHALGTNPRANLDAAMATSTSAADSAAAFVAELTRRRARTE